MQTFGSIASLSDGHWSAWSLHLNGAMPPAVSIILPAFNREAFLEQAFQSISSQTFQDWHLIVIDDGSTDRTREVVERLARDCTRPVEYVYQENRGAAGARNTGLDRSRAPYVAFYDSDDLWLPDYLARSISALEANPDVDWVFSPCRKVDFATGTELASSTFLRRGRPRRFMTLLTDVRPGGLHVIVDSRVLEFQLQQGMTSGPQNSVFRRHVFDRRRFPDGVRVGEDQLLTICALADRRRLGYFLQPLVIYHVHDDNCSFAGDKPRPPERFIDVFGRFVEVMERLRRELPLTKREARAFRRRMAAECFWQFGYNGLWRAGRRQEAVAAFTRSLRLWPWDVSRWRTFLLAKLRLRFGVAS